MKNPRKPDKPVPTQISRLEKVEDADQFPEAKVEATYSIETPPLVERDERAVLAEQQARSREKAAEKRRQDARFPAEIEALIDAYCYFQPHAKHPAIAKWLRKEHKQLLAEAKLKLKPGWPPLARKIGRYRRQK